MLMAKGHRLATLSCGTTPFDDAKVSVLLPQNGYVESSPLKTARNIANFIYRPEAARKLENLVLDFRPAIAHAYLLRPTEFVNPCHTAEA